MKKLLILFMVLVLSFGTLTACGGDGDKQDNAASNGASAGESHFSNATVNYFNEKGKSNYRIVRPDENDAIFQIAGTVFKAMK